MWSPFLKKLLKRDLNTGCFPVNIAKVLRTAFFMKHVRWLSNHLKSPHISFVVAGNGKNHIKNSNDLVDLASNNHEESDTFSSYCLGLVDLEKKVVCVKSNDTDVFTIMLGNYQKPNELSLLIAPSNKKWTNFTKVCE